VGDSEKGKVSFHPGKRGERLERIKRGASLSLAAVSGKKGETAQTPYSGIALKKGLE